MIALINLLKSILSLFSKDKKENVKNILPKIIDTPVEPVHNEIIITEKPEVKEETTNNPFFEIFKGELPKKVIEQLPIVIDKFNINNNYRLAHLLGQCSHESNGFKAIRESINYSVKGLQSFVKWGRITKDDALKYGRNSVLEKPANQFEIAIRIYGGEWGRKNLGNTEPTDGWDLRGTGYLQTTGRYNFDRVSKFIGIDFTHNPNLLAEKYPLISAAFFFMDKKLWNICDEGITDEIIKKITKIINGKDFGLKHRTSETNRFYNILNNSTIDWNLK